MTRADGARVSTPLFQSGDEGSRPISALSLFFVECPIDLAVKLNRLWHSRLPKFTGTFSKVCYVAEFNGTYYATAIWSNPVARVLPQQTYLELRRLAIAPDAPKNTASRMLAWMARNIRKRFPEIVRLISYQDKEVHTGTIYRAAGWVHGVMTEKRSRPWKREGDRPRNEEQSKAEKQRWEKIIDTAPVENVKRPPPVAAVEASLFDALEDQPC